MVDAKRKEKKFYFSAKLKMSEAQDLEAVFRLATPRGCDRWKTQMSLCNQHPNCTWRRGTRTARTIRSPTCATKTAHGSRVISAQEAERILHNPTERKNLMVSTSTFNPVTGRKKSRYQPVWPTDFSYWRSLVTGAATGAATGAVTGTAPQYPAPSGAATGAASFTTKQVVSGPTSEVKRTIPPMPSRPPPPLPQGAGVSTGAVGPEYARRPSVSSGHPTLKIETSESPLVSAR